MVDVLLRLPLVEGVWISSASVKHVIKKRIKKNNSVPSTSTFSIVAVLFRSPLVKGMCVEISISFASVKK